MRKTFLQLFLIVANIAHAQQSFVVGSSPLNGTTAVAAFGTLVQSTQQFYFDDKGRLVLVDKGDTAYFDLPKANESLVGLFHRPVFQGNNASLAGGPSVGLTNELATWAKHDLPQSLSVGSGVSSDEGQSFNCSFCLSAVPLSPQQIKDLTSYPDDRVEQTFTVNSIGAYHPGDYHGWFLGKSSESSNDTAILSLVTGSGLFPGNSNGAITISNPTGTFGIFANANSGTIGWISGPAGTVDIRASSIYTVANFYDSGAISASALTIGNLPGDAMPLTPGTIAEFTSTNLYGTNVLITNGNANLGANASLTIQSGLFSNTITSIAANGTEPNNLSGTFCFQAASPNGIAFNTLAGPTGEAGSIRYFIADVEHVRIEPKVGLAVIYPPLRLPEVTSDERRQMENPEPGDEVFDTDLQKVCVYTKYGWFAYQMKHVE
jgi:hypothetical protein